MEFTTIATDQGSALWSDDELHEAYLDARCREFEATASLIDEDDLLCPPDAGPGAALDAYDAFVDLEGTVRHGRALAAAQDRLIADALARAGADPEPWVGPDPTADPAWEDPRGLSIATVRLRRRMLAVRSAAADIGARLRLSEQQVRTRAHRADVLRTRCPLTWAACLDGDVSEQNAAKAAVFADSLPADAPEAWRAFDEAVHEPATRLTPGRFHLRVRAARERAHPESLEARHARAASDRAAWFQADVDGMATMTLFAPAVAMKAVEERIEEHARHLAAQSDERRTLAQLRADVATDLLTSGEGAGDGIPPVEIRLTIPALTLLGHDDAPAQLEGYGPIDLETARRLAGGSASWIRVLTDPVTGVAVGIDRRKRRIPKSLRRWLGVRHPVCAFPGCTRPSRRCDIDHRRRFADGGATDPENLGPLCEPHHVLKDETLWTLVRDPVTGELTWTSPTGFVADSDPPPF